MQSASGAPGPSEKLPLRCFAAHSMPALQRNRTLQPLCHEHHLEMRLAQVPLNTGSEPTQTLVYACPEPDCPVHYNSSRGYFAVVHNGNGIDRDMMPKVWCSQDGLPMFLADVLPAQRSFRLWRCPQCNWSRRNGDELGKPPLRETPPAANDHTEDQFPNLLRRPSPSNLPPDSGDPPPVQTKTSPVPADDGFRRDDDERLLPRQPDPPSDYPEELIEKPETRARVSTLQSEELLTQSDILEKETSPPTKEAVQHSETEPDEVKHGQDL